jgi:hypothetical protein
MNTLTGITRDIYKAADIVGREQVGAIPSVTVNAGLEAAAKGATVAATYTRKPSVASSITPSMTVPEGTDQTVDRETVTLDSVANVMIPWTGEEIRTLEGVRPGLFQTVYGDQLAQAFRAITNTIESALCSAIYKGASRAVGAAGTTPFGSNANVIAEARKILVDNGAPNDGRWTMLMDTTAGVNFRNLTNLQKVNEAGTDELIRRGTLLQMQGFMMKESAGIASHTKGTAADYLVDLLAGYAVGDTTLHLDTGTGTHVAGDIITFTGDSNKYVIGTGAAGNGDKDIVLNKNGLRATLADGVAATTGNSYTGNVFFHQAAVELAVRPYADPPGGDIAVDTMIVQDPVSGIPFEVKLYKGFKKMMLSVTVLYGYKVWKPDFVGVLLG